MIPVYLILIFQTKKVYKLIDDTYTEIAKIHFLTFSFPISNKHIKICDIWYITFFNDYK